VGEALVNLNNLAEDEIRARPRGRIILPEGRLVADRS
jgi:hypothetical protein